MSTLTYADRGLIGAEAPEAKPARKSFWVRLFNAIVESRQRRAEREIARIIAGHGALLTDETEREIMRRLSGGSRL